MLIVTLKLYSSPMRPFQPFSSSSTGVKRALWATISSFNLALSASLSSLEFELYCAIDENASYSSFMASQSIDSMELFEDGSIDCAL